MRKYLEKRKKRLEDKRAKLLQRSQASEDIAEVREINDQLMEITEELRDITEQLEALDSEESGQSGEGRSAEPETEQRETVPEGAQLKNANIVGAFSQQTGMTQERNEEDPFGTMEYRKAFKDYVQRGVALPQKYMRSNDIQQRAGVAANTNTLSATIPTTIMKELIKDLQKVYGQLYAKVRKINVRGGVKFPIAKLQASFRWITETTTSPNQDGGKVTDMIEFSYNLGEIRIAQTLLSSIVSLDVFEGEIEKLMLEAFLKAMDTGIVNGSGKGEMLGLLKDPRVLNTGNVVEMTADDIEDWVQWKKKFFAKLPLGYRIGEFIFPISTVESKLETIRDNNNNPIFKQATGLEIREFEKYPDGRFFGRGVSLVEPDIIPDFDTAKNGDIIGVYWQPEQYVINSNMEFSVVKYIDQDTNEEITKALVIVDGKPLDVKGVWLIKKKV